MAADVLPWPRKSARNVMLGAWLLGLVVVLFWLAAGGKPLHSTRFWFFLALLVAWLVFSLRRGTRELLVVEDGEIRYLSKHHRRLRYCRDPVDQIQYVLRLEPIPGVNRRSPYRYVFINREGIRRPVLQPLMLNPTDTAALDAFVERHLGDRLHILPADDLAVALNWNPPQ